MAVFRVQKTGNFTIMANHHLRDRTLSLKAKGLLSVLLSLPETWEYSVAGLAKILREGVGSISSGLKELEAAGYVRRRQRRDARGRMADTEYEVYEVPCLHTSGAADVPVENLCKNGAPEPTGAAESPDAGGPPADEPSAENPGAENPHAESAPQINTYPEKTEKSNKQESNHNPSHPLGEAEDQAPAGRPGAEEGGSLAEAGGYGREGLDGCECEDLAEVGAVGLGDCERGRLAGYGAAGAGGCEHGGLANSGMALAGAGMRAGSAARETERACGGGERLTEVGAAGLVGRVCGDLADTGTAGLDGRAGLASAGAAGLDGRAGLASAGAVGLDGRAGLAEAGAAGLDGCEREDLAEAGTVGLDGGERGDLAEAGAVGLDGCERGGLVDFGAAGAFAGGGTRQVARVREAVREKLGYDCIVTDENRERLDGIVELMTETLCSRRASIRVAGEEYPAAVVKERLWRLNSLHIQYVFECLENTTSHIRNIRQYLLATLFNAPVTKDSYYDARARRDRALGFGRGWGNE